MTAALAGSALAQAPLPALAATASRQAYFSKFCELFYRQKRVREAFETHVSPDYIQHSAGMAQGREAAIQVLEPMFSRPQFQITPLRTLWDGDLSSVILQVRVGDAVEAVVVDVYRHADGRIVEHWDVKSELSPEQRAGYFDGLR